MHSHATLRVGLNLRNEDLLIANHLQHYPIPPRPVLDRWRHFRDRDFIIYGLFVIVALLLALYFWVQFLQNISRGDLVGSPRIWILLLAALPMPYAFYILWIQPVANWWLGTSVGRPAVAELATFVHRNTPVAFLGVFRVEIDGQEHQLRLRVTARYDRHETWVQTIQPGDRIHVLIHPTKPQILLAYGPVAE